MMTNNKVGQIINMYLNLAVCTVIAWSRIMIITAAVITHFLKSA